MLCFSALYIPVHVHIPISFVHDNYKSLSKNLASFWLHCILSSVVHLYPLFCTGHGIKSWQTFSTTLTCNIEIVNKIALDRLRAVGHGFLCLILAWSPFSHPPGYFHWKQVKRRKNCSVPQNHSGIFSPDFHIIDVPNAFITRLKNFRLCNIN